MIVEQKPLGENENLAIVAMLAEAAFSRIKQVVQSRLDKELINAAEDLHDAIAHPKRQDDGMKHYAKARQYQAFLDVCSELSAEAAAQAVFSTVEIKPTPAK